MLIGVNPCLSAADHSYFATSKFVYSVASALDLFSLWKLALIAIGLKAAGGKNMSMAGALTATLLPWAIWTLCAASLAAVFNR